MKNKILIKEQAFSKLLRSISDPILRSSVHNSIKAVASDLLRTTTGDISLNALKSNNAYKNALLTSLDELSKVKYGQAWDALDDAQKTIVANEAGVALRNGIEYEIKATGRKIKADINTAQAAKSAIPSSSPLTTQLDNQIANLQKKLAEVNTEALTNVRSMGALAKEEITELIKGGITNTGTATVSNAKGFKYYFDKVSKRLVPIPKGATVAVKTVYITKAVIKTLMWLGMIGGAIWLISLMFPDSDFVIVDEDGKPIDLENITSGNLLKCAENLINNNGTIVQPRNESQNAYIKLDYTGEDQYDSHGGLKFYLDGRVAYGDDSRKGKWMCSLGGEVKQMNESHKKLSLMSIIEQAQNRSWKDGITFEWDKVYQRPEDDSQQNFTDCSTWDIAVKPYTIGCRSRKIMNIQQCFGDKPLDGIFDDSLNKIIAYANINMSKGITKEVYDEVMRRCQQNTEQQPQQPQQPQQTTAPQPTTTDQSLEFNSNDFSGPNESGGDFYRRLDSAGYFRRGELGDRKIRYKDNALSKNDYDKLTKFFAGYGYKPLLTKDVGDGEFKYVWIKRR